MRINRVLIFGFLLGTCFISKAQKSSFDKFKQLSCPEKWWVIFHPFVAKKALIISLETRSVTDSIKKIQLLKGMGNGDQVDAFRHSYWMARLSQEICWRKARKLGKAHEKGNFLQFKKKLLEDGQLPDKISSEMDLFNNEIGISVGRIRPKINAKNDVIFQIKAGNCKIIKTDTHGNFLDVNNNIIPDEDWHGKWENKRVLVNSNFEEN